MNPGTLENLFKIFQQDGGASFLYIAILVAALFLIWRAFSKLVGLMAARWKGIENQREAAIGSLVEELRAQHEACKARCLVLENRVAALEERGRILEQHNSALNTMVLAMRKQMFNGEFPDEL